MLDLGAKTVYEIKYDGKTYQLKEPTARDINNYQKASKENEGKELENLLNFLNDLGLPKEIGEELGLSKIEKLSKYLIGEFSEKK